MTQFTFEALFKFYIKLTFDNLVMRRDDVYEALRRANRADNKKARNELILMENAMSEAILFKSDLDFKISRLKIDFASEDFN